MNSGNDSRQTEKRRLAFDLLRSFGELRLAALGCSMVPVIFPGDVLTIRRLNSGEIQRGDVILYERDSRFFVHRVVGEHRGEPTGWITRGDALHTHDAPVAEHELLGKVVEIERGKKRLLPVAPTGLRCVVRWSVRHSNLALKLVLHWHSRRTRKPRGGFAHFALEQF